ncbi:MAG: hypothetical protein ABW199_02545 [Caulobacterales bacterium]
MSLNHDFYILDVTEPGNHCFAEVALALQGAFAELGHVAPIVSEVRKEGVPIVLGGLVLDKFNLPPDRPAVIYNFEQVSPNSPFFQGGYLAAMKRYDTWDYSPRNIEALKALGVDAALCGVGYAPSLSRIPPAPTKDIDIVFVGQFHPRRHAILSALHDAGCSVVAAGSGCYGAERDQLYARAKIVLNIHYFDAHVFEIVRVSYLLANEICVVSEIGLDQSLEAPFADSVAFAPYEKLVETCLALLSDEEKRTLIAREGRKAFAAMSQTPMLERALETFPARQRGLVWY